MPLVKRGAVQTPLTLVDINRLAGLDGVTLQGEEIRIGALARLEDLRLPLIRARQPVLAAALAAVAIRRCACARTLVGNLVHNGPGAEAVAAAALARARLFCRIGERTDVVPVGAVPAGALALEVRLDASPPGTRAGSSRRSGGSAISASSAAASRSNRKAASAPCCPAFSTARCSPPVSTTSWPPGPRRR